MTSRDRILATIQGRPADRVPVAPFVHTSTVKAWKRDANAESIAGTIAFCKHYGFDIIHRNMEVRHSDTVSTENWQVQTHRETKGTETFVTTLIQTPGGVLRQVQAITALTSYLTASAQTECFIKTEEDFYLFRRYVPAPVPADYSFLHKARSLLGEDGVCAPWVWGVFNYMAHLRPLEDLLTDPYDNPELYEELARFALDRLMRAMTPLLEQDVDLLSYTGNIASGTMVGPAYFQKNILPYEKTLIDFIQARCMGIIYHNCGDADNMTDCYNRLMPACYESMTEPPFADNSLEKSLRTFNPEITLIGNMDQIEFLRKADAAAVTQKARQILEAAATRKRFILGTSDLLEEGTPEENLFALARAVL